MDGAGNGIELDRTRRSALGTDRRFSVGILFLYLSNHSPAGFPFHFFTSEYQ